MGDVIGWTVISQAAADETRREVSLTEYQLERGQGLKVLSGTAYSGGEWGGKE